MQEWWEGPELRDDQVPCRYVAAGEWPNARLQVDAPLSAHYGQEVARRLKAAMDQQRISQRTLARLCAVAQATISRTLRGEVLPDLGTLAKLEAALGVDIYPTGLFRNTPSPTTPDHPRP
ncbi:helix-turn-helix domain-containing protein [Streptomyces sp. NPDC001407]|uniref:helix-turn-helix domain-containing protein n=1 Tax=unclassified Streptomyces TaxID=2593676 RepID=UPI0036CF81EC